MAKTQTGFIVSCQQMNPNLVTLDKLSTKKDCDNSFAKNNVIYFTEDLHKFLQKFEQTSSPEEQEKYLDAIISLISDRSK